jgi:hypothetical protein
VNPPFNITQLMFFPHLVFIFSGLKLINSVLPVFSVKNSMIPREALNNGFVVVVFCFYACIVKQLK